MSKRSFFVRLVPCRCLRGEEEAVTSLDYSHCSLETVPKEIFSFEKTLQELFLDANQIEELPKQLFNCQLLQRLSMPDNDVTVLPAGVANLVNLRELDVSKNSIQEFPENIKNCKLLTIVEASVNPIAKLPDGFTQLMSLSQLYLNDAFLEFLPASFGRLTKLQILELRENQLKMLPKSMQKLTQLERLDLGSNEFTEVPEVLEQLTGIKELWMDGNRLTFLPGMLGTLKQLLYLDVSKNNLEMVDEQICGCESLQDLLLSNNALTQLPGSIGSLKKLTALKVDENQIMELPDSIGGLTALDELDCSFNEIEALPPSIGQCAAMRTFAADHNFLTQLPPEMGNWKNATVLFLHSNKLESLPEEMGDMHKLKVINLSNNKLKNIPYSFTKLSHMTAMWLSENQSKPLIPLQKEEDPETHKTVLTNYMFPQQTRTEDYVPNSDSESFNPVLWEEQRKHRAQVAFECDEDKDERETPPREGNLKRYPTPYPDELKNMVKTAQSVAHRLKEDESNEDSGRDPKPSAERNHIGVQDVGVKVIEAPHPNGLVSDLGSKTCNTTFTIPNIPEQVSRETESESFSSQQVQLKSSESSTVNHEDTLEDSEELSDEEEEMKIAEMRPPLIEISINQPKVVTLSKDKKDDSKDADSLLDDTVANSNQNNSNCSSPSRMSDSVSLTTDSSQDNSLCTPEREAKMPFLPKTRHEDENMNPSKDSGGLLHNGNGSETSLQALLKAQHSATVGDYDLSAETRRAFIEKGLNNSLGDGYTKWDQINMNLSHPPTDNMLDHQIASVGRQEVDAKRGFDNRHFQNGNQQLSDASSASGEMSRSTEELSPERRCHTPQVSKSQSVSNIEAGSMKLYSFDGDAMAESRMVGSSSPTSASTAQGQSIVRSKSASLLNDQNLQVCPSSDPLPSARPPTSTSRYPSSSSGATGTSPPQYNVQYSSKDGMWAQRTPMPPEYQGYLPPATHSLANTNYSNRNQAPPYPLQPQQRGLPMGSKPPADMWATDRVHSTSSQSSGGALQRQSSTTSTASVSEPRRMQLPEGDYLTYRDIHTLARGPLAMSQSAQRPISTRTYSIDTAAPTRLPAVRPQPHELPERTMSVSDFHYPHGSPSKRPNVRVRSEHSLLDGPGMVSGAPGRVPADWRDQVMRHIEAKKMEKDDVFGPPGQQSYTMDSRRKVPLMNGQVVSSARPQVNQTSMARHPSREQLIDYLMLKVSQQASGPMRPPHEIHVKVEKNPELGFSISGGVGGRGNPFRPDDNGIFVTRVQPEGPAFKILQPGDKIIQANGYSFVNIDHGIAVSLLKTFPSTVELTIVRDAQA
ncbi:erbin isoform X1 [Syngnathoides biaculeatus]|uniref:erbin isoform X1 n=1 Tax=Syngnathoides biaculeatus TaxID=300417 RepID=UPI002ADD4131|nr:erbin isoform X1 [Syngnathoides biaculeatus]XP_061658233.1 erbin isoform X1 [Syngnathoides biaculeatus]